MEVVLLTKDTTWGRHARDLASVAFGEGLTSHLMQAGQPLPDNLNYEGNTLLSFLCPIIIPGNVLRTFKLALNFHPGSSDYPGTGCYNFAIYNSAKEYGAVCHHMDDKADHGKIVEERRFKTTPIETVETLKLRTLAVMTAMFHDVVFALAASEPLAQSNRNWTRPAYTRKQLNELCHIDHGQQDADEIERRVKATTYPGCRGPYLAVGSMKFYAPTPQRKPLA